jgi:hypothetical protein
MLVMAAPCDLGARLTSLVSSLGDETSLLDGCQRGARMSLLASANGP